MNNFIRMHLLRQTQCGDKKRREYLNWAESEASDTIDGLFKMGLQRNHPV